MPPNADSRRGSHLREHLLFLLLLLTLNVFAPPAPAQNAPPAPADKSEQQKAAYAALADLLQDDKARAELINHLKQAADDTPTAAPATPEESTPATLSDSLNALAQEGLGTFNQKLGALQKLIDSGPKRVFNPAGFFRALGYFLLTVAVTFALFHLIRRLIAPLYKRMGSWGTTPGCSAARGINARRHSRRFRRRSAGAAAGAGGGQPVRPPRPRRQRHHSAAADPVSQRLRGDRVLQGGAAADFRPNFDYLRPFPSATRARATGTRASPGSAG